MVEEQGKDPGVYGPVEPGPDPFKGWGEGWTEIGYTTDDGVDLESAPDEVDQTTHSGVGVSIEIDGKPVDLGPGDALYVWPGGHALRRADHGEGEGNGRG